MPRRTTSTATLDQPTKPETVKDTSSTPKGKPDSKPDQAAQTIDETAYGDQLLKERRALENCIADLADGKELSAGRWAIVRKWLPDDRAEFNKALDREKGRLAGVRKMQAVAGTLADRSQAESEATNAEVEATRKRPEIENEIARLERQLVSLKHSAHALRTAADRRTMAIETLRVDRSLPPYVLDEISAAARRHVNEWKRELVTSESRLTSIVGVLSLDPSSKAGREAVKCYVSSQVCFGPTERERLATVFCVATANRLGGMSYMAGDLKADAWNRHLAELKVEAETLRKRLVELQVKQVEAADEILKLRGFYVPS